MNQFDDFDLNKRYTGIHLVWQGEAIGEAILLWDSFGNIAMEDINYEMIGKLALRGMCNIYDAMDIPDAPERFNAEADHFCESLGPKLSEYKEPWLPALLAYESPDLGLKFEVCPDNHTQEAMKN